MLRRSLLVVVCFLVASMPLAAYGERVLYVLVDTEHHRALIPEGSVLPAGLQIRMERAPANFAGPLLHDPHRAMGSKHQRITSPPLVFEYAPIERFEAARVHYAATHHRADTADSCFSVYVSDSQVGVYDTYYDGLTSTACGPSGSWIPGNSYLWSFTVTGDYSDADPRIGPYVGISDNDSNFYCYHPLIFNESYPSCSASATTLLTNTYCVNTVYTYGLLYKIEYTNDPYHDNYYGFNFEVDWCTAFY